MHTDTTSISVSELTRRIKELLETRVNTVFVQGELSNVKLHSSGHLYFTLKDESSQIPCVMWKSKNWMLSFEPADGLKVSAVGRVTVYEPRGAYQLDTMAMRPLGVGKLQEAYERLRAKLADEGLFDAHRKKDLPRFPRCIGIITSESGAAVHDILKVLRRRFPIAEVVLRPVRVQGEGASRDIVQAIADVNTVDNIDVIILARGGGSAEDLWAFNEENVARAIFRSEVPIVSAVGHETDVTIADYVADLRAPTPSAAAELVVPDRAGLIEVLRKYAYTLRESTSRMVEVHRRHISYLLKSYSFNKPHDLFRQMSQRSDELSRGLHAVSARLLDAHTSKRLNLERRLTTLDPVLTLKRGYAIVSKNEKLISSKTSVHHHDELVIRFQDGTVTAEAI